MIKNIATGWSHSLIASHQELYGCGTNDGELGFVYSHENDRGIAFKMITESHGKMITYHI